MRRVDTPAKYDLFNVESEVEMSEDRLENSHHIVATLLYVSKRARVDIDLAVLFLCTRVSRDTEEDWDKLRRLLNYLSGTIYIPRIVGENGMDIMETYVDISYDIHRDMKRHTD